MAHRPSNIAAQEAFARATYLPKLARVIGHGHKSLCVDLSHYTLFFFRGLLKVLRDHGTKVHGGDNKVRIVRIRRDAVELARSVAESDWPLNKFDKERNNKFHLEVGFNPFEAPDSIVLQVPMSTWSNFSAVQQGLWVADETEAQWLKHISESAKDDAVSVSWSKMMPGNDPFRDYAVEPIAHKALGLGVSSELKNEKTHAEPLESQTERDHYISELKAYRAQMHARSPGFAELSKQLPSHEALSVRYELRLIQTGKATDDEDLLRAK